MVDQENGHSDFPQLSDLANGLPDGASNVSPDQSSEYDSQLANDADKDSEDCSLFIGDIPKTMTEEQMKELFSPYGEVVHIDIKRDRMTKASLGYAFIQYKTRSEASAAKKKLHKTVVASRAIRIGWAQKNTNLFVGDLDTSVTSEMLRDAFRVYGDLVDDETFAKKQNYGFVKYKRRGDAEVAKREMDGKLLGGRRIRTGWGDTNTQRHCVHIQFDPVPPPPSTNPNNPVISEEDLFKAFSPYGTVMNVHLPKTANRLRGFGFVRYSDTDDGEESAEAAISALHNTQIADVIVTCNFGKKQHPRRPSITLPPPMPHLQDSNANGNSYNSNMSEYANPNPTSPKPQLAREDINSVSNNDNNDISYYDANKEKVDKNFATEMAQHNTGFNQANNKSKGKARSHFHNKQQGNTNHSFSSPLTSRHSKHNNNNNNNSGNASTQKTNHNNINNNNMDHQMQTQYQMMHHHHAMYQPTTTWMPTHEGWVPYVIPQYYPPTGMPIHGEDGNGQSNLQWTPEEQQNNINNNANSNQQMQPVYMYSYPNHPNYNMNNNGNPLHHPHHAMNISQSNYGNNNINNNNHHMQQHPFNFNYSNIYAYASHGS